MCFHEFPLISTKVCSPWRRFHDRVIRNLARDTRRRRNSKFADEKPRGETSSQRRHSLHAAPEMWTGVGRRANVAHISKILGNTSTAIRVSARYPETSRAKKFARATYDTRGVPRRGGGEKFSVVSHLVRITANLYFQP